MTVRLRVAALVVAPLLLAGCAAADAGSTASATHSATHSATRSATAAGATPPENASMVCSDEIRGKVQQVLKLPALPTVHASWIKQVYTCTYDLPVGPMVLTVQVAPTKTAAEAAFQARQKATAGAATLLGLGEHAYATADGTATVIKDAMTLTVDTTALPAVFGAEQQKRTDLAYEIASDVLGCWTGND
jgi:hypothetical protein